jgi:EamA domain-containing membrane protein RarD
MNNELQNDLQTKVWQWIESSAQAIGDFAAKEIPPFIHEYLQWKFYEATFDASFRMIFVLVGFVTLCCLGKIIAWAKKYANHSDGLSYIAPILSAFIAVILVLVPFPRDQIKDMVQIKVAPKVYLIEKAAEIIKNK